MSKSSSDWRKRARREGSSHMTRSPSALEDVEINKEQAEDFYTYLIDHGVDLTPGESYKHLPYEQPLVSEEESKAPKLDLSVEPRSTRYVFSCARSGASRFSAPIRRSRWPSGSSAVT